MRDISTEDLIQTLMLKTQQLERATNIYKLHPTAQTAGAVKARKRDQDNALRALNTHLRECLRLMKRTQQVKMPSNFIALTRHLPRRTVLALRKRGVTHPETMPLRELLRIPGLGVQGATCIAARTYANQTIGPINWPELEQDEE